MKGKRKKPYIARQGTMLGYQNASQTSPVTKAILQIDEEGL